MGDGWAKGMKGSTTGRVSRWEYTTDSYALLVATASLCMVWAVLGFPLAAAVSIAGLVAGWRSAWSP